METSEVIYLGELRTKATHLASGNSIITDAPVDNNGKGEYFSPTDLVATSTACCVLTIIGINSASSGINIEGTKVKVKKIMSSNPRRIGEIHLHFKFPDIVYSQKEKQIIKKIVETCPVMLSLHQDIKKIINLEFNDENIQMIL